MRGTLKTPQTYAPSEHVAQKIGQFVQMNQALAIVLPYIKLLRPKKLSHVVRQA